MSRIKFWDDTAEPLPADFSWPKPLPDITLHHLVPKLGYRATLLSRACRRHALQSLALTDSLVEVAVNRLLDEPASSIRFWTGDLLLALMRLLSIGDLDRIIRKLLIAEPALMSRICVRFVTEIVLPRNVDWFTKAVFCNLCVDHQVSGAILLSSCSPMREWMFEEIDANTRLSSHVGGFYSSCTTFFDLAASTLPAAQLMTMLPPFRQRVSKTCFECAYQYNKPALEILLQFVPESPSADEFDDPGLRLYVRMRSMRGLQVLTRKTAVGSCFTRTVAGVLVNIPSSPGPFIRWLAGGAVRLILMFILAMILLFHFVWFLIYHRRVPRSRDYDSVFHPGQNLP